MKTNTHKDWNQMQNQPEKICLLLGPILKRKIEAAAMVMGVWTILLIWSFFK